MYKGIIGTTSPTSLFFISTAGDAVKGVGMTDAQLSCHDPRIITCRTNCKPLFLGLTPIPLIRFILQ